MMGRMSDKHIEMQEVDLVSCLGDCKGIVTYYIGNGGQYGDSQDDGFDVPLKDAEDYLTNLTSMVNSNPQSLKPSQVKGRIMVIRMLVAKVGSHRRLPRSRSDCWVELVKGIKENQVVEV